MKLNSKSKIGIIGAGAMGSGIAQVASTAGHEVCVYDIDETTLNKSKHSLEKIMSRMVKKNKVTHKESSAIQSRITYAEGLNHFECCDLIIEAVVEDLPIKQDLFKHLEKVIKEETILATNTSSLSIASIGGCLKKPENFIGIHFFNPAPLMPLVEIVPSLVTSSEVTQEVFDLIQSWEKKTVVAKDTPGFIVNRIARPFYSEAIKMLEEGFASVATIDWAMRDIGGFRMGPFELMDLIGHDVNYTVTETVWKELFYDPRYRPSITQKRLKEAKRFGRKSGQGFYNYSENIERPTPDKNKEKGALIFERILFMLINEALEAKFLQIANDNDIETAMTKGVNYPKGLLKWAEELGYSKVLTGLDNLYNYYKDDRYRASVLLRKLAK